MRADQHRTPRKVLVHYRTKEQAVTSRIQGQPAEPEAEIVLLQHPKSGAATCYLVIGEESVQEVNWYKQSLASWFIGDSVCEDGSLYLATPVDPLFLLLPLLDRARFAASTSSASTARKGSNSSAEGVFRSLDETLFVPGYPSYLRHKSLWEKHLHLICQTRDAGGDTYYRLDTEKVLKWLRCKTLQTAKALAESGAGHVGDMDEQDRVLYAIGLITEYLPKESWGVELHEMFQVKREGDMKGSESQVAVPTPSPSATPDVPLSSLAAPASQPKPVESMAKRKAQAAAASNTRKITSFFSRPR